MSVKRLSLDRFTLKVIAVAAMFVDHFAAMFLVGLTAGRFGWVYYVCRFIGRMTAPIMCFFLSEGFIHTSSRKRYIERMALFALISQPFYTLAFYGTVFTFHSCAGSGSGIRFSAGSRSRLVLSSRYRATGMFSRR